MSPVTRHRSAIARHLFAEQLRDAVVLWALFAAAVALFTAALGYFSTITMSVLEQAGSITRWFVAGWGAYLTAVYLPLYVTHGYTRREFAAAAAPFVPALAVLLGALMAAGFAIEGVAYRALAWPQTVSGAALYDAPSQLLAIGAHHTLLFAAWITAGALVGAGFYRDTRLGLLLLGPGLALVAAVEGLLETFHTRPLPFLTLELSASPAAAAVIYLGAVAVGYALTWAAVRDLPMRTRNV